MLNGHAEVKSQESLQNPNTKLSWRMQRHPRVNVPGKNTKLLFIVVFISDHPVSFYIESYHLSCRDGHRPGKAGSVQELQIRWSLN